MLKKNETGFLKCLTINCIFCITEFINTTFGVNLMSTFQYYKMFKYLHQVKNSLVE